MRRRSHNLLAQPPTSGPWVGVVRSRRTSRSGASSRAGVSLFEVLLAMTIFMGAYVAISGLTSSGMTIAVQGRLQTQAIMRCESKMAEVVAAIEPLEDTTEQQFEDDQNWNWSLQTGAGPHADIMLLMVTVTYAPEGGEPGVSQTLTRFLRDPAIYEVAETDESGESI